MNEQKIVLALAVVEAFHLAELIEQFTSVLSDAGAGSDPAVQRLTPNVYVDDADASADFARATRSELIDRRRADAERVQQAIASLLTRSQGELIKDESIEEREIVIPAEELDAWLRTLTALRLVIATRFNITAEDDDHDVTDHRFGVYDWLGYRLDVLVALADAQDNDSA